MCTHVTLHRLRGLNDAVDALRRKGASLAGAYYWHGWDNRDSYSFWGEEYRGRPKVVRILRELSAMAKAQALTTPADVPLEVGWKQGPGCAITTSLSILNVSARAALSTGTFFSRYDVQLTYHLNVTLPISQGSIEYPLVSGGIQWRGTHTALCTMRAGVDLNGTACPLQPGLHTAVTTVLGLRASTEYGPADVTSNGYTPGFRGLRVLTCAGTMTFRTPAASDAASTGKAARLSASAGMIINQ